MFCFSFFSFLSVIMNLYTYVKLNEGTCNWRMGSRACACVVKVVSSFVVVQIILLCYPLLQSNLECFVYCFISLLPLQFHR